jgi:hypothetical protein|tara:strand:+ start:1270 stop:1527 length:258 start_codon:yes stop_codon:yes gene_type:complete
MEEIKTDITQRSYDKQNVLWAKLSAVRLGLVDKDQVKLGNQRDYLTWIPICVAKSRKLLKHNFELDKLGQVYSVNTRQYKDAKSR